MSNPLSCHIQTPTEIYRVEYPEIEAFTKKQLDIFWTSDEIKVEKDIHDILTNFTEAEKHGVFTTLKLFTLYEMKAGSEYWTGRFMKMFPRHEFQAMGATFGMMELAVHAKFYNKINELLNATDDSFYTDYVNNPVLKERMEFVDKVIGHGNDLISLAGFSMVEGVVLYSSFAFLKHFQSNGKNKLSNVVAGINSSAIDEELHSLAGAWCFKELAKQRGVDDLYRLTWRIHELAEKIYEHESAIIDMIFEKEDETSSSCRIEGITAGQMREFVMARINTCLENLGLDPLYAEGDEEVVSRWFYKNMKGFNFNDNFNKKGREYVRKWSERRFGW